MVIVEYVTCFEGNIFGFWYRLNAFGLPYDVNTFRCMNGGVSVLCMCVSDNEATGFGRSIH